MVDIDETRKLLASYVHSFRKISNCGFLTDNDDFPDYSWLDNKAPDMCLIKDDEYIVRRICRDFYLKLKSNNFSSATCPLGIKINCEKKVTSSGLFCMIIHSGFDKDLAEKTINELPRKTKKDCTKAIEKFPQDFIEQQIDIKELRRFSTIVDTILAGRVSEAMRALAHEILTPIQGALNDVHHMKHLANKYKEFNETVILLEKNIDSIIQLSKQMSILINSEINLIESSSRRINVFTLINKIWERYLSLSKERKIELDHKPCKKIQKEIEAVPDQIETLFNLLIENAIKYSFNGFNNKPTKIIVEYKEVDKNLQVSIDSLGCLITEDELRNGKIFELGYRGLYSNDRSRNGTGSGLYIASKILKAHNGTINVVSSPIEQPNDAPLAKNIFNIILPYRFKGLKI